VYFSFYRSTTSYCTTNKISTTRQHLTLTAIRDVKNIVRRPCHTNNTLAKVRVIKVNGLNRRRVQRTGRYRIIKKNITGHEVGTESEAQGPSKCHVPDLVKSHWNQQLPSEFTNLGELADGFLVQAHGIVGGEDVSKRAPLHVTRPAHARNISDARERRAVDSLRRSTVKRDSASATALEVVPGVDTLVGLLAKP